MKKHNQNHKSTPGTGPIEGAAYLLSLVALGYVSLPMAVAGLSFTDPYGFIFRVGTVTTFILAFAATLVALRGQAAKLLLRTLQLLVGITVLAILALLFGVLQDALGVNCLGSNGPQACTKEWTFVVQFGLSNVLFIPLTLAFNIAFIIGLRQSLRKSSI